MEERSTESSMASSSARTDVSDATTQQTVWIVTVVSDKAKPLVQAYTSLQLANAAASAYSHWANVNSGQMPIEVTKDAQDDVPSLFLSGKARVDVSRAVLRDDLPRHLRDFDPRGERLDQFLEEEVLHED